MYYNHQKLNTNGAERKWTDEKDGYILFCV